MANLSTFLGFFEILKDSLRFLRILRDSLGFFEGFHGQSIDFSKILLDSSGILWGLVGFFGI